MAMVAIKRRFLQSVNSMIVLLISLLGFTTSCEPVLEYGTPHADFIITGKVESVTDSQPIKDIIVEMRIAPKEEISSESYLVGTGFSNGIGNYYLKTSSGHTVSQAFQIKFTDTDGPLNGEYETLDTTVVFQDPKFTHGDGSWYKGYTEKVLDIKLKPKQ